MTRRRSREEMLRLNASTSLRRRSIEYAASTSSAKVTVFIPPAVPAGLPPITINPHIQNLPASESSCMSIVLKPAVRAVID